MSKKMRKEILFMVWFAAAVSFAGGCHQKFVVITSDPNEATVYLNGLEKGITTYKEKLEFTDVKEYNVLLKKPGHFDGKTTIREDPPDKTKYHIALERLNKLVTIESDPKGAIVYINGVETGITDLITRLEFYEPDEHEIVLRLDKHYEKKFTIRYEPDGQTVYPDDPKLEPILTVSVPLIEVEPTPTVQGVKLKVVHKPTLAYLEVIERSPNAKSVTRVTSNEDPNISIGAPILSPRENILVFEMLSEEENEISYSNLWRTAIGEFGKTRVTYGKWLDVFPTFTPDANNIVLSSNRVGLNTLWRIKTGGSGGLTNITNTLSEDYSPSVTPDGKLIVYTSNPPDAEEPQIWTVRADGSLPTQLREGESPQVSPDGAKILFTRRDKINKKHQVWLMDLDGGRETQLTQNVNHEIMNPRWSPDGKWIIFDSNEALDSKKRQNSDIWMMASDGSRKTQLTTNGSVDDSPCWDHEGKYIYFRSNRGGMWNIWRFEPILVQ